MRDGMQKPVFLFKSQSQLNGANLGVMNRQSMS